MRAAAAIAVLLFIGLAEGAVWGKGIPNVVPSLASKSPKKYDLHMEAHPRNAADSASLLRLRGGIEYYDDRMDLDDAIKALKQASWLILECWRARDPKLTVAFWTLAGYQPFEEESAGPAQTGHEVLQGIFGNIRSDYSVTRGDQGKVSDMTLQTCPGNMAMPFLYVCSCQPAETSTFPSEWLHTLFLGHHSIPKRNTKRKRRANVTYVCVPWLMFFRPQ
jgi:hypothetical protein